MSAWYEDESFWSAWQPSMFGEERWEEVAEEMDQVLELLQLPEGAEVRDLCCGPGRHSLELARRGYRVTGVDRTEDYLADLRTTADAEGLEIDIVQEDMRRFSRPEAFDGAINLFTSFGYFEDQEDDRQVARNLFESLRPGGKLLMDLMGKEVLARIFRARDWREREDGTIELQVREITDNWTWIKARWIMFRDGERIEHKVEQRLYSAAELMALLEDAGFSDFEVYGHVSGIPYDHQAKRLVALARKGK